MRRVPRYPIVRAPPTTGGPPLATATRPHARILDDAPHTLANQPAPHLLEHRGPVTYIASDWTEVGIRLPLSWRTRNYVGTIFGGAMYSAVDPFYMIMLIKRLGPGYIVWDKAAAIRFRRPGTTPLEARCAVDPGVLDGIRAQLEQLPKLERVFTVDLKSADGTVHAIVEKTLHISRAP